MQGFDNKFKDFPDYILGITYEIWEQRRIERKDQSPVKLKLDSPIIVRGSTRKK